MARPPNKRHEVIQPIGTSHRFIALTKGYTVIVDASDFEWLSRWPWFATINGGKVYAARNVKRNGRMARLYMHRAILSFARQEVDHRDGNTLDCRRKNLRRSTHMQNVQNQKLAKNNKSGYKGVNWSERLMKWRASITVEDKHIGLGTHESAEAAARAYDRAAREHFGEFAHTNFH